MWTGDRCPMTAAVELTPPPACLPSQILIWNLDVGEPVKMIDCHSDVILCMSFNTDGSLLTTTCKDKKLRVIEPRSGRVLQVKPHFSEGEGRYRGLGLSFQPGLCQLPSLMHLACTSVEQPTCSGSFSAHRNPALFLVERGFRTLSHLLRPFPRWDSSGLLWGQSW